MLLAGCVLPGDAAPIVKIGLVAPFEGLGRPLGYAVLPAVKVALDEANAGGRLGRYRLALVALNDDGDPAAAAQQARALAQDPAVIAVLGPWSSETAAAAGPGYAAAGLPGLLPAALAGPLPGLRSLCPPPAEIAAAMLAQASRLSAATDGEVAVSGPQNALAEALRLARGPQPGAVPAAAALRLFTGDAAEAADDLVAWAAAGWRGRLVGGPDLARPWFIGRAGAAAEGSQAAVCAARGAVPAGFAAAYRAAGGGAAGPEAALAYAATRIIVEAAIAAGQGHGMPGRDGVAAALAARPLPVGLTWLQVSGGQWTAAGD